MPTHKKTESERFKGPAKYAEYLFARALITGLQHLPIGLAYRLGRVVGWLAWKCLKRRRATVRKNLEIVNAWMKGREACPQASANAAVAPDALSRGEHRTSNIEHSTPNQPQATQVSGLKSHPSHPPQVSGLKSHPSSPSSFIPHPSSFIEPQVREVFLRAGANLFAGFTFNRMSPEQAARHIEIEGIEHLKAALAEGKGAIILLAHMGPWEALAQLPAFAKQHSIKAPFGAMYRPLNNTYLDDWFKAQRESQGTRLFSRRDGFHKPVDFLRGGGMLGILADQNMRQGAIAPFFGKDAMTTPLPGLLWRRTGAALLAVSFFTSKEGSWKLHFNRVIIDAEKNDLSRLVCATKVNAALERILSQSTMDGFWFHDRFKSIRQKEKKQLRAK